MAVIKVPRIWNVLVSSRMSDVEESCTIDAGFFL